MAFRCQGLWSLFTCGVAVWILVDISAGMVSGGRMGVRHVMSPRMLAFLGRFGRLSNAVSAH